jgi:protein-S-isoprenylcysteine O-methyltransferase Ste14
LLSILAALFLTAGYAILGIFALAERELRVSEESRSFSAGESDRRSTRLVGAAFAIGLVFPLALDLSSVGVLAVSWAAGLLGAILMGSGLALRIWSAKTLGRYYTRTLLTVERQRVVDRGPYSLVRHPGYLGGILLWSGFALLSENAPSIVLIPLMFVAVYGYRMAVEEEMLLARLGSEYAEYQRRTRMMIPYVY